MPELDTISVKGFKSIASIEKLQLGAINVVIGPNGSAKSNFIGVIISTQSPFLLDHFRPEDVLVTDRVDGGTQFTRLDPAKLDSWLQDYSLGQLWEKNELGGRPAVDHGGFLCAAPNRRKGVAGSRGSGPPCFC